MVVTVNGHSRDIAEATPLVELLTELAVPERGVAVALDGQVVCRADWAATELHEGAVVEVLTAVQGG